MPTEDISDYIKNLFDTARAKDGREYIYTLLRVTGPQIDRSDSLVRLRSELGLPREGESDNDLKAEYRSLIANEDVLELLANLLNCAKGNAYSTAPFYHLDKGSFPKEIIRATLQEKIEEVCNLAAEFKPELSTVMSNVYATYLTNNEIQADCDQLRVTVNLCRSFLKELLETYFSERLKYRNWNRFQKVSAFEVMELLTNEEYGLYGFRMHFPTGSYALFERHPDSHDGRNFFVPDVSFFVGLINEMQNAWLIEDKRLHELKLPGRYNRLGEWMPIAGPTAIETLSNEARSSFETRLSVI